MISRGHIGLALAACSLGMSVPIAASDGEMRRVRRKVVEKQRQGKQHTHSREIARRLRQEARLAAKRASTRPVGEMGEGGR